MRTLRSGRKVEELPEMVSMTISSHCPDEWLFVDLFTGNVWCHDKKTIWRPATTVEIGEMKQLTLNNIDRDEL